MEAPGNIATSFAPETAPVAVVGPQPYAFSQPSLFSSAELRRLTADYQELRRSCATRLAVLFRTEFDLSLAALQTPSFRQFAGALAQPTHLTLFKAEPCRGIGVLEISSQLALALSDRLMGGAGDSNLPPRELTEIEGALLDQVAQLFIEAWCGHWVSVRELKPSLLGHESDARFLQTSPADSPMLVARFEAKVGETTGHVALALPFSTIEPILEKLRAELKPPVETTNAAPAAAKPAAWNAAFDAVAVTVNAELAGPQITARQLPQLKIGDVLPLPAESANLVQLRVGGATRFTGRLGTRDEHWAVEVIRVLKT